MTNCQWGRGIQNDRHRGVQLRNGTATPRDTEEEADSKEEMALSLAPINPDESSSSQPGPSVSDKLSHTMSDATVQVAGFPQQTLAEQALLDLNGMQEMEGTWRAPVTLPCVYEPLPDFEEKSVVWKTSQQDHGLRSIFHRDATSGDQTLLVSFKGRLAVPKTTPGVVSLQIKELEIADSGQYICEVTWEDARNRSRITKQRITALRVVKVPVTKPVIQFSRNGSVLPAGVELTLTCLASGSPPLTYRWLKEVPWNAASLVGQEAVLRFQRLEPSDVGRYYCEAKNRVGTLRVQRSDPVQLTVEEMTTMTMQTTTMPAQWTLKVGSATGSIHPTRTTAPTETLTTTDGQLSERQAPRKASLPLYLIILIALLCAVLVFAVSAVVFFRRRGKVGESDRTYQVAYHNNSMNVREGGSPESPGVTGPYEEPIPRAHNNYTVEPTRGGDYVAMGGTGKPGEPDYESLVKKMESEYETVDCK